VVDEHVGQLREGVGYLSRRRSAVGRGLGHKSSSCGLNSHGLRRRRSPSGRRDCSRREQLSCGLISLMQDFVHALNIGSNRKGWQNSLSASINARCPSGAVGCSIEMRRCVWRRLARGLAL
jgi:hypothetical protein